VLAAGYLTDENTTSQALSRFVAASGPRGIVFSAVHAVRADHNARQAGENEQLAVSPETPNNLPQSGEVPRAELRTPALAW
jgi:hypothetical protein